MIFKGFKGENSYLERILVIYLCFQTVHWAIHSRSWWLLGCQKTKVSTQGQQSRVSSARPHPVTPSQPQTQPSDVQASLLSPQNWLLIPIRHISPWAVLDQKQCLDFSWEDCMGTRLRTEEIIANQSSSLGVVEQLYTCNYEVCCQPGTGLAWSLTRRSSPPEWMTTVHSQDQLWATPIQPLQEKSSRSDTHHGQMVLRQHQWYKYSPGFGCTCSLILCVALSQQLGYP